MWSYAPWQGRYLPGSLPPRDRLRAYATWCNAVEGNTTFYATPTLDAVKSWAEQTTADFREGIAAAAQRRTPVFSGR